MEKENQVLHNGRYIKIDSEEYIQSLIDRCDDLIEKGEARLAKEEKLKTDKKELTND